MLLTNAFSINMLVQDELDLYFEKVSIEQVYSLLNNLQDEIVVNAIGHTDLDEIVRDMLAGTEIEIPKGQRISVQWPLDLDVGHQMLVAQYRGPRLPEGCKLLPEGAEIEWWVITC